MTMLNNASYYIAATPGVRRSVAIALARLGRLINRWIAAMIAHGHRRIAECVVMGGDDQFVTPLGLHPATDDLSDRDLKDIGIYRGEIGDALAERAAARSRMQESGRF